MELQYFDRQEGITKTEKVYGDFAVKMLYGNLLGRGISTALIRKPFSYLYGAVQASSYSKKKVAPFIKNFEIKIEEFVPEEGRTLEDPYSSFNSFFIRKFKDGARPIESSPELMPAFSEARYFGYESLNKEVEIPVKGKFWKADALLSNERWGEVFDDGPCLLARLCPVDYHRFHFPDDGNILDFYDIPGVLHSVNPLALKSIPGVFMENERRVTIMDTKNFGKLAYVEVGAICVGKIIQSRPMEGTFKRGEEKGYFLFGGSTVILLGEKGRWKPDDVILENTSKGIEVYQTLGSQIASTL